MYQYVCKFIAMGSGTGPTYGMYSRNYIHETSTRIFVFTIKYSYMVYIVKNICIGINLGNYAFIQILAE